MNIYLIISLIGIGFVLFLLAELLSRATEDLEEIFGQGIAGGVIAGIVTALPETIIVIESILNGKMAIAISTAIGGNIILFTFGIGFVGLLYSFKWKKNLKMKEDYRVEQRFLLISTILISIVIMLGYLNVILSVFFILVYIYYIAYRIKSKPQKKDVKHVNLKKDVGIVLISSFLIVFLAEPLINLIVQVSEETGITPAWFALFFIPILSDAEEFVTSIKLALSGTSLGSTALVSVIGSKIENGTLLLGIAGLLAWTPIRITSIYIELISVALVNIISVVVLLDGNIKKWESVSLMVTYFAVVILTKLV